MYKSYQFTLKMFQLLDSLKSLQCFIAVENSNIEYPILYVINLCSTIIQNNEHFSEKVSFLIKSSLDRMQERINIGHWKDVSLDDRQCITVLSYFKIIAYLELNSITGGEVKIDKAFEMLDSGLIFGAPLSDRKEDILHRCASIMNAWKQSNQQKVIKQNKNPNIINYKNSELTMNINNEDFDNESFEPSNVEIEMSCAPQSVETDSFGASLKIESCPSLERFNTEYFIKTSPVVLLDCISHWPALKLWGDIDYLLEKAGHRTVPIELGSKYTDKDWTQKLMTLSDFIREQIVDVKPTVGYLAQYQLFNQIPDLMNDLREPDYCCLKEDVDDDSGTDINAWFGPCGTVSPLHFDPKHNLLAQVVGEKLVILFSPEDSQHLYCHPENILCNTAQVDPTIPDYDVFPDFRKATPYYCILKAGQMLYIPPKWWHYVKSLSVSFSVSFWWK